MELSFLVFSGGSFGGEPALRFQGCNFLWFKILPRKLTNIPLKNDGCLAILCDLFGMVKWPPTIGDEKVTNWITWWMMIHEKPFEWFMVPFQGTNSFIFGELELLHQLFGSTYLTGPVAKLQSISVDPPLESLVLTPSKILEPNNFWQITATYPLSNVFN